MIVVLSGEGPSDLGHCNNVQGSCQMPEFVPGPMTWIVDKIISDLFSYSPLQDYPATYRYLSEQHLQDLAVQRK